MKSSVVYCQWASNKRTRDVVKKDDGDKNMNRYKYEKANGTQDEYIRDKLDEGDLRIP